ncbi:MAG: GlcNAc-PI de-N-acetylase [Magnetovibrio sp.]|nr:GlcNAc-PI de-N-acetylase [Magnetovibrio sp.]|tara:strand:+ start:5622 stop:6314 length:693 start_codon:yes stop_codon:yes gene_type:complete
MTQESILVVAAHPDDEVLGCGGTIAKHTQSGDKVHILIIAEGLTSRQKKQDVKKIEKGLKTLQKNSSKAAQALGAEEPHFFGFPDNRLDSINLLDIIKPIENIVKEIRPDSIYVHHGGDLNIDHQIVNRAVITACRPLPEFSVKNIFTYETVSSTEWGIETQAPFRPTRFINISDTISNKLSALKAYDSEMRPYPHARSFENVEYLARTRGASVGIEFAEAFTVIREVLN